MRADMLCNFSQIWYERDKAEASQYFKNRINKFQCPTAALHRAAYKVTVEGRTLKFVQFPMDKIQCASKTNINKTRCDNATSIICWLSSHQC